MLITAIASDAPVAAAGLSQYRYRPAGGERTILPTGAAPVTAPPNTGQSAGARPHNAENAASAPPEPPVDRTTVFAAAVIAGALSPTPTSLKQVLTRIGASTITEETAARLKDLLA